MDLMYLYRLSGWSQDIIWIGICWLISQRPTLWKKHYLFFSLFAITITLLEIIYAITAITLTNNLFLDYLYIPIEFFCLSLFLKNIIKNQWLDRLIVPTIIVFISFQIFLAFWEDGYKSYNRYGVMFNNIGLITLSIWALSKLAKKRLSRSFLSGTDEWITVGILLIYSSIIIFDYLYSLALPYKSDSLLYFILISQNFLKSTFLYFYFRGIQLAKSL